MTNFRYATPPPPNPSRSLYKSLRLPRSHSKVATWLFSDSHLPFHEQVPLLTPHAFSTSFAVRVHQHYDGIGPLFDPFGVEDSPPPSVASSASTMSDIASQTFQSTVVSPPESPSPGSSSSGLMPIRETQGASITFDLLLTPVAYATPSIVVGYSLTTGNAFDPRMSPIQSGTFRGKAHLNGRFAYDVENDHLILVVNAITPLVSGIVDFTFTGISRDRFFYTVPCAPYGPHRLPSRVLAMFSNVEIKMATPNNKSPSSDLKFQKFMQRASSTMDCVPCENEVANIYQELSQQSLKDVSSLLEGMRSLSQNMRGSFEGPHLRRDIYDPMNGKRILSRLTGGLQAVQIAPNESHRQAMIVYGWSEYCAWAYGLRAQRRTAGLINSATASSWPGADYVESAPRGRRHAAVQTDDNWCESCDSGNEDIRSRNGYTSATATTDVDTQTQSMQGKEKTVKERRSCSTCNGSVDAGMVMADEQQIRLQKMEAKRRKNRQSATRSNLKRKEREEQQRSELVTKKRRAVELDARREELEAENVTLRRRLADNGLTLPTHKNTP